jgi:hypothetical protein
MTELLTGIVLQPNFPGEDLTDDNADMLELLMANLRVLDTYHRLIEQESFAFAVGHNALVGMLKQNYDNKGFIDAFSHGITVFEAITATVGGEIMRSDIQDIMSRAGEVSRFSGNQITDYHDGAVEDFTKDMPRTANTIVASTSRFHGPLTTYALIGAASSWRFEQSIPA